MSYSSSKTGSWAWLVVFFGLVVLVADIVSLQMLGTKTDQFVYVTAPGGQPVVRPVEPQDVKKSITLPDGHDMVTLPIEAASMAHWFIGPGSRVSIFAALRIDGKLTAIPLLVDVLVVALAPNIDIGGTFPSVNLVSFAVTEKQALAISLAKSRGCVLELLVRGGRSRTEADAQFNVDEVIKFLRDWSEPACEVAPAPRPVR